MRGVLSSLLLFLLCGLLVIFLRPGISTAAATKTALAQSLHDEAVSAIRKGKDPDEVLSPQILKSYPQSLTEKTKTKKGEIETHGASVLSYRDAIALTEDVMKDSGLKVKITIQATPGKCNVKYKPVIGDGAELDAGQTDVSADLPPRWYVFSCDCTTPPTERRVDCTSDEKITFHCQ